MYQMVFPYLSIYIVALGASATQLGTINSAGMVAAAIVRHQDIHALFPDKNRQIFRCRVRYQTPLVPHPHGC